VVDGAETARQGQRLGLSPRVSALLRQLANAFQHTLGIELFEFFKLIEVHQSWSSFDDDEQDWTPIEITCASARWLLSLSWMSGSRGELHGYRFFEISATQPPEDDTNDGGSCQPCVKMDEAL
jgi:hypothetical protein